MGSNPMPSAVHCDDDAPNRLVSGASVLAVAAISIFGYGQSRSFLTASLSVMHAVIAGLARCRRAGHTVTTTGGTMSAQVAIVCDECGDLGNVGSTPHDARAILDSWARRHGMDLCPLCRFIAESRVRMSQAVTADDAS